MTIIETVTKKLKLFSRRKVVTLLSGNYDSLFRGRGLEIDSVRQYIVGDDVKDIDWKSTARTNVTHTRTYTALRDQRIIIVADTSRSMLLPGYTELNKLDALYGMGVMLGNFARRNHDLFALCAAAGNTVNITRYGSGTHHLESVLRTMDAAIHAPAPSQVDISAVYTRLLSASKKRSAVFILSDSMPQLATLKTDLHRLSKRHQVFYVQLAPSWPFAPNLDDDYLLRDIETDNPYLPDLAASPQLQKEWSQGFDAWYGQLTQLCKANGVAHGLVKTADQIPQELQAMFLQAKRYAQHRR